MQGLLRVGNRADMMRHVINGRPTIITARERPDFELSLAEVGITRRADGKQVLGGVDVLQRIGYGFGQFPVLERHLISQLVRHLISQLVRHLATHLIVHRHGQLADVPGDLVHVASQVDVRPIHIEGAHVGLDAALETRMRWHVVDGGVVVRHAVRLVRLLREGRCVEDIRRMGNLGGHMPIAHHRGRRWMSRGLLVGLGVGVERQRTC